MIKKRLILLGLLVILVSSFTIAEDEDYHQLFSDYVVDGETFTADGIEYFVGVNENNAFLEFNDKRILLNNGECKDDNDIRYCIGAINESYHNSTLDQYIYQAEVEVKVPITVLEIERTFSNENPLKGESTKVTTKISNIGSIKAENITFNDGFDNFIISAIDTCTIEGNNVTWTGDISGGNFIICRYTLRSFEAVDYESVAEAEYFNGYEMTTATDEFDLEVSNLSLDIKTKVSPEYIEVGDIFNFSINLNNTDSENNVIITLIEITPPEYAKLDKKYGGIAYTSGIFRWTGGSISPENGKNFLITFTAEKQGDFTFDTNIQYSFNRLRENLELSIPLKVEGYNLKLSHNLKELYESEEEVHVLIDVKNPSLKYDFEDVDFDIESNFQKINGKVSLGRIGRGSTKSAVNEVIYMPLVEDKEDYYINATMTFRPSTSTVSETINELIKISAAPEGWTGEEEESEAETNDSEISEEAQSLAERVKKSLEERLFNKTTEALINKTNERVEEITDAIKEKSFISEILNNPLLLISNIFVIILIIAVIIYLLKSRREKAEIIDD
ncbi:MAG: hypothetical protein V1740_00805 [Candidatus Woesearchaeota archaeon]